jgi:hypothetical protein
MVTSSTSSTPSSISSPIDLDKISLNDMLTGFDKQSEVKEADEIDNYFRSKYSQKLEKYTFIRHKDLANILQTGDLIRYSKKSSCDMSCSCFIGMITYLDPGKNVIDQIIVGVYGKKKLWKLYPANHYIYKYDKNAIGKSKRDEMIKILESDKSNSSRELSDEELLNAMKNLGKNKQYINSNLKLNTNVGTIFNNHHKRKEENAKKSYMNMRRDRLKINDLDDVVNEIIQSNESYLRSNPSKKKNNIEKETK